MGSFSAGIELIVLLLLSCVLTLMDLNRVSSFHGTSGMIPRTAAAAAAAARARLGRNGLSWSPVQGNMSIIAISSHSLSLADVCHAYQILTKGGLKDENIIVFMYDDIAHNKETPRRGIIINKPKGHDVYAGVPKDYIGEHVNAGNFYAVLLGNKSALTGGSRKVVDSGPDDHIFVYYTDHGGLGSLCQLENDIGKYATMAANALEDSFATYCDVHGYYTCLGDLYSVSWMEDSEHNLDSETLEQQYKVVKKRALPKNVSDGSHVMRYRDLRLSKDIISLYFGSKHAIDLETLIHNNPFPSISKSANQRNADLNQLW